MTQVSGKTILISGGVSGIGRQLALKIARQGGRIVLWDLDQEAMARTLDELRQAGTEESWGYVCNVADRERVYEAAKNQSRHGDLRRAWFPREFWLAQGRNAA